MVNRRVRFKPSRGMEFCPQYLGAWAVDIIHNVFQSTQSQNGKVGTNISDFTVTDLFSVYLTAPVDYPPLPS